MNRKIILLLCGFVIVLSLVMQFGSNEHEESVVEDFSEDFSDNEMVALEDPALPQAFFTIHVEPNTPEQIIQQAEVLEDFVELADEYEIPITIMLSANWPEYFVAVEERLDLLHSWVDSGHEIAMHHHGLSHPAWDGYSASPAAKKRRDYVGDMNDFMASFDLLGVEILTGSGTDSEADWPDGLIYSTDGFEAGSKEYALSEPTKVMYGGDYVWELRKRGYATNKPVDVSLEFIEGSIGAAEVGQVLGVNTADTHLEENMEKVEELLELLSEATETMTVAELLANY